MKSLPNAILLCVVSALILGGCEQKDAPAPAPTVAESARPITPVQPLVQPKQMVDWCKEHAVPESICTRCNSSLIADFKAKGDWCKTHELPESQCLICHPELKAKFEAMAPKT